MPWQTPDPASLPATFLSTRALRRDSRLPRLLSGLRRTRSLNCVTAGAPGVFWRPARIRTVCWPHTGTFPLLAPGVPAHTVTELSVKYFSVPRLSRGLHTRTFASKRHWESPTLTYPGNIRFMLSTFVAFHRIKGSTFVWNLAKSSINPLQYVAPQCAQCPDNVVLFCYPQTRARRGSAIMTVPCARTGRRHADTALSLVSRRQPRPLIGPHLRSARPCSGPRLSLYAFWRRLVGWLPVCSAPLTSLVGKWRKLTRDWRVWWKLSPGCSCLPGVRAPSAPHPRPGDHLSDAATAPPQLTLHHPPRLPLCSYSRWNLIKYEQNLLWPAPGGHHTQSQGQGTPNTWSKSNRIKTKKMT